MKKFQFTLSKLLNYKDQILEKEKTTLLQFRSQQALLEKKIEELEMQFEHLNKTLNCRTREGITAVEIRGYKYHMENIRVLIKQNKNELRVIAMAIENQIRIVVQASQEVSGLDKLKEKQFEEYSYIEAKKEEEIIAEFVTSKVVRQSLSL